MNNNRVFKSRKSEQTYERVREAAWRLFVEKGYERTTMRDISAAGGLGLGALYYYFQSKEEVVLSFYEEINQQVARTFRLIDVKSDAAEGFAALMETKLDTLAPHRDLMRVILKEAIDPQSPLCPLNEAAHQPLDLSLDLFKELAERGRAFGAEDIEQATRGLWLLHMGILAYWIHDRSPGCSATRKAVAVAALLLTWSGRLNRIPGFSGIRNQVLALTANLFVAKVDVPSTQT